MAKATCVARDSSGGRGRGNSGGGDMESNSTQVKKLTTTDVGGGSDKTEYVVVSHQVDGVVTLHYEQDKINVDGEASGTLYYYSPQYGIRLFLQEQYCLHPP